MRLFAKVVIGACLLTLIGCASTRKAVPASRGNLSSVSYHGTGCFQDDLLVVEFMPDSQFAKVTLDNSQAVLVPVRHLRKIREISPDQLILRKDPGSDGMVFSSFVKMVFVYPDRKIVISENVGVMSKHYPRSIVSAWGLLGGLYQDMREGRIKDAVPIGNEVHTH